MIKYLLYHQEFNHFISTNKLFINDDRNSEGGRSLELLTTVVGEAHLFDCMTDATKFKEDIFALAYDGEGVLMLQFIADGLRIYEYDLGDFLGIERMRAIR